MTLVIDRRTDETLGQLVNCLPWSNRHWSSPSRYLYLCATGYHSVTRSDARLEVVR